MYTIPARYRRMENLHIVFWLFKDLAWCLVWKPLGIIMIFPTLIISIIIAWNTRHIKAELAHNLAISFWITANSYWMISEFFEFDTLPLLWGYPLKYLALLPFLTGIAILGWYYLYVAPREKKASIIVHPQA